MYALNFNRQFLLIPYLLQREDLGESKVFDRIPIFLALCLLKANKFSKTRIHIRLLSTEMSPNKKVLVEYGIIIIIIVTRVSHVASSSSSSS